VNGKGPSSPAKRSVRSIRTVLDKPAEYGRPRIKRSQNSCTGARLGKLSPDDCGLWMPGSAAGFRVAVDMHACVELCPQGHAEPSRPFVTPRTLIGGSDYQTRNSSGLCDLLVLAGDLTAARRLPSAFRRPKRWRRRYYAGCSSAQARRKWGWKPDLLRVLRERQQLAIAGLTISRRPLSWVLSASMRGCPPLLRARLCCRLGFPL